MDGKKLIIAILIITVLLRLPSLFEPFTYGDEGVYLTLGQALRSERLVFYRDIHDNKPPLLYLLAAVSGSFFRFRLLLFTWSLLTVLVFYEFSRSTMATLAFAILTSLHTFEGNVANAENFMMLLTILGFYFLTKTKQSKINLLISGGLFSLATLFKVPAAFDFAAALVFLLLTSQHFWQKLSPLILGFFLPISLSLIYYLAKGALASYLQAAFFQNIPYLSSWTTNQPQAAGLPLALMGRAGLVVAMIGFLWWAGKKINQETKLIILWFAFALFASLLSSRPYPHYLLQVMPPLSLSLGLIFSKKVSQKIIPPILATSLIIVFIVFKFWHYPNWSYYRNFYQYALRLKDKTAYWQEFDPQAKNIYDLAKYLQTHTTPGEKIFLWSNQPSVYALANRLPLGRFCTAYHIQDFDKSGQTLQQLKAKPPRFVVQEKNLPYPPLEAWLQTRYLFDRQFGPFLVYHRIAYGKIDR